MNVEDVIWLPQIIDKLTDKHGVLPNEVEDILFGSPRIRFVENGSYPGEDLYAATGQTGSGR